MKDNKYLQGAIGLLAIMLTVFVAILARNANQQYNYIGKAPHERDTFTVQGEGKVSVKPDLVKVSLGVTSDAKTVKEAQSTNTVQMNAIVAALKALNIEAKDIQTSNYSIYPRYDYSQNGRQTILGYTVSQNVEVKVRDLDKVGDVLARATDLGANQVGGLDFTIDDPKLLQDQARDEAIDDAKKKADLLASKLGLQVVKIVTFAESGNYVPSPRPMMLEAKSMDAGVAATPPSIEAGSLDVNESVSVTFEVR